MIVPTDITGELRFKEIMERCIKDVLEFLLFKKRNFSILCNYSLIEFDPPLPDEITANFKPLTLFAIAGYTFDSFHLDNENVYFEAGFGPNNIGSYVTLPLFGILQIIIDDTVVVVNLTAGHEEFRYRKIENEGIKNSMEALLSNPENQKFLKGRKK